MNGLKDFGWYKHERARNWILFWTIAEWIMNPMWRVPRLKRIRFFKNYAQVERELTK